MLISPHPLYMENVTELEMTPTPLNRKKLEATSALRFNSCI